MGVWVCVWMGVWVCVCGLSDFWYHSLLTYMSCVCVVTVNILIRMR